jgi:NADH:ubiquinone oxidoreductase subunit 5 (subunit L)/multisubunit Na+/H+ antiporter MnhA subunit
VIGALTQRERGPKESTVVAISQAALWLSIVSLVCAAVAFFKSDAPAVDFLVGDLYRAGDYGFGLRFLLDAQSLLVAFLAELLLLATSRFSAHYLHREAGFTRFFILMLIFASGMLLLVLSGSYDLMFAGWELVGLTSVLLVGFFHDRPGPVRASLRVLITYRLCDIGLLIAPIFLQLTIQTSSFMDIAQSLKNPALASAMPASIVALFLIIAAMGKSAQFPVGGWLPRAMEGPTASSAVFYGGLSVHAGVYLLLRSAPILDQAPTLKVLLVLIGLTTAVMATLSGQVSADAKSAIAYATITQVGLMFAECGCGLYRLALAHLLAHAVLRYYQFLRTPSALQDALARRRALGAIGPRDATTRWERMTLPARVFIYRLALERFEVEVAVDRFVARPVLSAARFLNQLEVRLIARLAGSAASSDVESRPAVRDGESP